MNVPQYTTNLLITGWVLVDPAKPPVASSRVLSNPALKPVDILQPLRRWLDRIELHDRKLAYRLCKLIPAQCPFERDVKVFGYTLFHIPPMCKLNPVYEEVVALRFRALCYLADECGEDITMYC